MKFCYLKRDRMERFNSKRGWFVQAWRIVDAEGTDLVQPWSRLKSDAIETAKQLGYTILPDGMTPEQWHRLRSWRECRPHTWRQALLNMWYTGADESVPWMRQLRNTLGPKGLAKFKF